ncbi:MAG TPA: four helix bundle protein [Gemmatimonadales bacterium]|nr:four helix bundle protein [Gemmatimonadales bacterium]
MGDFKKLKVWQKSHQLALAVYKSTAAFPVQERYGLTGQLRRASTSIPANIAEGCGRGTDNELGRYVRISLGSSTELEYHLLLAKDLGHLSLSEYDLLRISTLEVQSMLAGLSRKVRRPVKLAVPSPRLIASS